MNPGVRAQGAQNVTRRSFTDTVINTLAKPRRRTRRPASKCANFALTNETRGNAKVLHPQAPTRNVRPTMALRDPYEGDSRRIEHSKFRCTHYQIASSNWSGSVTAWRRTLVIFASKSIIISGVVQAKKRRGVEVSGISGISGTRGTIDTGERRWWTKCAPVWSGISDFGFGFQNQSFEIANLAESFKEFERR